MADGFAVRDFDYFCFYSVVDGVLAVVGEDQLRVASEGKVAGRLGKEVASC